MRGFREFTHRARLFAFFDKRLMAKVIGGVRWFSFEGEGVLCLEDEDARERKERVFVAHFNFM